MTFLAFLFLLTVVPAGSARSRHPPMAASECHLRGAQLLGWPGTRGGTGKGEEGLKQAKKEKNIQLKSDIFNEGRSGTLRADGTSHEATPKMGSGHKFLEAEARQKVKKIKVVVFN